MSESDNAAEPQTRLTLIFDGADYQGEMGARELGAVLESLSNLAQGLSAAQVLRGASRPTVRVQAFNDGSFDIAAVIEAIGPGGYIVGAASVVGAAFTFWWKNMRRVVVESRHDAERGTVQVTMRSGEVLEWTEEQWRIYNSRRIRRAVQGIAAPLSNGASMTLSTPAETITVPTEDAYLFDVAEEDESVVDVRRFETVVYPDTVSFNPEKKWRLWSRETGDFAAAIEDKRFIEDVHLGRVRIGRNDSFEVGLRIVTTRVEHERPIVRWFVERVINYYPGAEQGELTSDAD